MLGANPSLPLPVLSRKYTYMTKQCTSCTLMFETRQQARELCDECLLKAIEAGRLALTEI